MPTWIPTPLETVGYGTLLFTLYLFCTKRVGWGITLLAFVGWMLGMIGSSQITWAEVPESLRFLRYNSDGETYGKEEFLTIFRMWAILGLSILCLRIAQGGVDPWNSFVSLLADLTKNSLDTIKLWLGKKPGKISLLQGSSEDKLAKAIKLIPAELVTVKYEKEKDRVVVNALIPINENGARFDRDWHILTASSSTFAELLKDSKIREYLALTKQIEIEIRSAEKPTAVTNS